MMIHHHSTAQSRMVNLDVLCQVSNFEGSAQNCLIMLPLTAFLFNKNIEIFFTFYSYLIVWFYAIKLYFFLEDTFINHDVKAAIPSFKNFIVDCRYGHPLK